MAKSVLFPRKSFKLACCISSEVRHYFFIIETHTLYCLNLISSFDGVCNLEIIMKKTYTYKGFTYRLTDTTTDVTRYFYGKPYRAVAYVYKINEINRMPLLTSHSDVKDYINRELLKQTYYW